MILKFQLYEEKESGINSYLLCKTENPPKNECKITKKEEIKRYLNEKDSKL